MRYFGKIMMGLAALATLPLAAQGPAPRETPSEPAAAAVQGADPIRVLRRHRVTWLSSWPL